MADEVAEVLVDADDVRHPGRRQAEQEVQARPIDQVGERDPDRNSGTAVPMKMYAQRFSREYRPGAMNAQIWYSQIGRGDDEPDEEGDLDPQVERVEDADKASWLTPSVLHPVCPRITAWHNGRSMRCQTGSEKTKPDDHARARGPARS